MPSLPWGAWVLLILLFLFLFGGIRIRIRYTSKEKTQQKTTEEQPEIPVEGEEQIPSAPEQQNQYIIEDGIRIVEGTIEKNEPEL